MEGREPICGFVSLGQQEDHQRGKAGDEGGGERTEAAAGTERWIWMPPGPGSELATAAHEETDQ